MRLIPAKASKEIRVVGQIAFRVLSLDGGGAKGFYSLGVLQEIEELTGSRLCDQFDLVYGTSTGAIIAALICLGHSVEEIRALYRDHVVKVMTPLRPSAKSAALSKLAADVFGNRQFTEVKTRIGLVATRWVEERPMIFKADVQQTYRGKGSFTPGFGVSIADAVEASCSAYPMFQPKTVVTDKNEHVTLIDGAYCANNPTLYAIADATRSLNQPRDNIRVVSVGVGEYPTPQPPIHMRAAMMALPGLRFGQRVAQKMFEVNTKSMGQLSSVLFEDIQTVRINERYTQPEMATDMFEHDLAKLDILYQRGRTSYRDQEPALRALLT